MTRREVGILINSSFIDDCRCFLVVFLFDYVKVGVDFIETLLTFTSAVYPSPSLGD